MRDDEDRPERLDLSHLTTWHIAELERRGFTIAAEALAKRLAR